MVGTNSEWHLTSLMNRGGGSVHSLVRLRATPLAVGRAGQGRGARGSAVVARGVTRGGLAVAVRRATPKDLHAVGLSPWGSTVPLLPAGAANTPAEAANWVVAEITQGYLATKEPFILPVRCSYAQKLRNTRRLGGDVIALAPERQGRWGHRNPAGGARRGGRRGGARLEGS
jgi:hypothetical protein